MEQLLSTPKIDFENKKNRDDPVTSNIVGKSICSAIKSLLTSKYEFMGGDKVQGMFVKDVLKLFKEYNWDAWNLQSGQTMCLLYVPMKNRVMEKRLKKQELYL